MSARDQMTKLLDQLMGQNRDGEFVWHMESTAIVCNMEFFLKGEKDRRRPFSCLLLLPSDLTLLSVAMTAWAGMKSVSLPIGTVAYVCSGLNVS